jgi:transposase
MFSDMSPEERGPQEPPLRRIRVMGAAVLKELAPPFERLYACTGRPSIAPEQWRRALLRQALSTIRRERRLMEQRAYSLLFRWVVGLDMDDSRWAPAPFRKHRARLREGEVARAFFNHVWAQARERALRSEAHCTAEGTLIEAWAGPRSFKRKAPETPPSPPGDPGHPSRDFRGERRTNASHASATAPEARLCEKARGREAKLASRGRGRMGNRHGLVGALRITQATGTAAREAALARAEAIPGQQRGTWGADKSDAPRDFVRERRELRVTPHGAQSTTARPSAIDGRTARRPGAAGSQRERKCVEEIRGWMKTVGRLRKPRHRGVARGGWMCTFAAAVDNLVRMRPLAAAA